MIIIKLLFCFLFIYLAVSIVYLLIMAIAGRFGKLTVYGLSITKKRIVIIIPAYKEDAVIVDTARKAATHNYPRASYHVIVVADNLQPETIMQLEQLPITVLEAAVHMKSRSIHAALEHVDENNFDIAMILDADNVMGIDCLEKINDAFQHGCCAVQCHRTAKNHDTSIALLDAISEEININLFRRGPAVVGISAAPAGSGMALSFNLLKKIFSMPRILTNPGEDREIDMQLMKQGIFMHFIEDAYVYDEKVTTPRIFEQQRIRWMEAQLNHLKRFFEPDMKGLRKTSTYAAKFFQNLILPRLFLIVILGIIAVLTVWKSIFLPRLSLMPGPISWGLVIIAYAIVLVLSVPRRFYTITTLKAIIQVPVLIIAMLRSLGKLRARRQEFLHTRKSFKS